MITPQEIQEKTFVKAVFGGYDMASVDEFLEPLTIDYIALYKEVSTLKSKMKVLVETIEEYRREEESVKKALVIAQKSSDELLTETKKKCAQMVSTAESLAKAKADAYKNEAYAEEDKLNKAKQLSQNYFDRLRTLMKQQIQQVDDLAAMEIHTPLTTGMTSSTTKAAFDVMDEKLQDTAEVGKVQDDKPAEEDLDIDATRIIKVPAEGGLYDEILASAPASAAPAQEPDMKAQPTPRSEIKPQEQRTSKFEFIDLQFGKDYDPKK